jgi:TusA-related sulfurtransferase
MAKQFCQCEKINCPLIDGEWCRTNFHPNDYERCPFPKVRDKEILEIIKNGETLGINCNNCGSDCKHESICEGDHNYRWIPKKDKAKDHVMTRGELCQMLENVAKEYRVDCNDSIKRDKHMHNYKGRKINQDIIDAILVGFINRVALWQGLDLGLYTHYLKDKND